MRGLLAQKKTRKRCGWSHPHGPRRPLPAVAGQDWPPSHPCTRVLARPAHAQAGTPLPTSATCSAVTPPLRRATGSSRLLRPISESRPSCRALGSSDRSSSSRSNSTSALSPAHFLQAALRCPSAADLGTTWTPRPLRHPRTHTSARGNRCNATSTQRGPMSICVRTFAVRAPQEHAAGERRFSGATVRKSASTGCGLTFP